jgi:hypothetical protein
VRLANECLKLDPQNRDYTVALAIGGFAQRGDFAEADRLYARAGYSRSRCGQPV